MRRSVATLFSLALAGAAFGTERPSAPEEEERPELWGGFDLDVTLTEVSGVSLLPDAYQNQLALSLEPRFRLGRALFRESWAEPLALTARLMLEHELAGSDPRFRGRSFASVALWRDVPEAAALAGEGGRVDGAARRPELSDLSLELAHGEVATIRGAGVGVGVRLTLPTSVYSRNAGLRAAVAASVGLKRKLGRASLRYDASAATYFFAASHELISHDPSPVLLNGQLVEPYRPLHTGNTTPSHSLTNAIGAELELAEKLSLSAEYALTHQWARPLSSCAVEGVPTADVCRDGTEVGPPVRVGQSDQQSFWLELELEASPWLSLGLGLATSRPLRNLDGSIANPFFHSSRDNFTTVHLAVYAHAEALAASLRAKESER